MTNNLFVDNRTVESIAWDLALTLASKDPLATTPEALLQKIELLLPECLSIVGRRKPEQAREINLDSTF